MPDASHEGEIRDYGAGFGGVYPTDFAGYRVLSIGNGADISGRVRSKRTASRRPPSCADRGWVASPVLAARYEASLMPHQLSLEEVGRRRRMNSIGWVYNSETFSLVSSPRSFG